MSQAAQLLAELPPKRWHLTLAILCLCLFSGCVPALRIALAPGEAAPRPRIYAVRDHANGDLVRIDPEIWAVEKSHALLPVQVTHMERDPLGRVWIGYAMPPPKSLRRARTQVFDANGRLQAILPSCSIVGAGFHFAAGRAFVGCSYMQVAVFDLKTLALIDEIDPSTATGVDFHFVHAVSGTGESVTILGSGEDGSRLAVFDARTLEVRNVLGPLPIAGVEQIVHYRGRLFLLNSYSDAFPDHPDLIIVDLNGASPHVATFQLPARAPLWGAVIDEQLYIYHHPGRRPGEPLSDSRAMTRMDLRTHATKHWELSDGFRARDMAVLEGRLIAAGVAPQRELSDLFAFNPDTGTMQHLADLPSTPYRLATEPESVEDAPYSSSDQPASPLAPLSPLRLE